MAEKRNRAPTPTKEAKLKPGRFNELRGIPTEACDQRLLDVIGRFLDWYHVNRAARSIKDCEATLPRIITRTGNKHLSLLRQADYNLYK